MKTKLIALFAATTVLAGIPAALAVASPDTKSGTKDSSSKLEKKAGEYRDKSVDTKRGTREGVKTDRRQDDRRGDDSIGERNSNEGTSGEEAGWSDSPNAQTVTATFTSSNDSSREDSRHDRDSLHKEGSRTDRRSDNERHAED